jgi:hypothetical protein
MQSKQLKIARGGRGSRDMDLMIIIGWMMII